MDQNNEPPKIVFEGEEFQRPSQSLFLFFGGGSSSYNEKVIPPMPAAGVGDPNFRP